jgi:hypothetical protein
VTFDFQPVGRGDRFGRRPTSAGKVSGRPFYLGAAFINGPRALTEDYFFEDRPQFVVGTIGTGPADSKTDHHARCGVVARLGNGEGFRLERRPKFAAAPQTHRSFPTMDVLQLPQPNRNHLRCPRLRRQLGRQMLSAEDRNRDRGMPLTDFACPPEASQLFDG